MTLGMVTQQDVHTIYVVHTSSNWLFANTTLDIVFADRILTLSQTLI